MHVPKYAYVAQGKGGLIKVGHCIDVLRRAQGLRQEFKKKGDVMVRIEACEPIIAARTVEMRLINFCRTLYPTHSGFEWFVAADFDVVYAQAVKETSAWKDHVYQEWTAEQSAAARASYRVMREQRRLEAIRRRELYVQRSMASKRNRPKRVMDAIVATVLGAFPMGAC